MKKLLFSSIMVLGLFFGSNLQASELVVMKVTGQADYKVGDVFQNDDALEIPDGATLLLISSLGKKIQIAGPFVGTLGDEDKGSVGAAPEKAPGIGLKVDLVQSLARLFKTQVVETSSLGAFRSIGTPILSDPWSHDVYKGQSYCYQLASDLKLWRAQTARSEKLILKSASDQIELTWPAGDHQIGWPVDLPAVSSEQYSASLANGETVQFALHKAPDDLPTRIHVAAWMAENKCDQQAMLLVVNSDIDKMLEGLAQDGKF